MLSRVDKPEVKGMSGYASREEKRGERETMREEEDQRDSPRGQALKDAYLRPV